MIVARYVHVNIVMFAQTYYRTGQRRYRMAVNSIVAAGAGAAPSRGGRRARGRTRWTGWAFVGPFLVVFAFALIVPIGYAIYLSLFRQQLIGGNVFVGLSNYKAALDRKSTRLNSSHANISYAVFCLKKKN